MPSPPSKYQEWHNPKLPRDAASPYQFKEVMAWREEWGKPKRIKPTEILNSEINVDGLYWSPEIDGHLPTNLNSGNVVPLGRK